MALGNAFPSALAEASIRRQLTPGAVIKFTAVMDDDKQHEKRFVVLHVDDNTVTCVINSELSPFVRARQELLKCQVAMLQRDHPFMDWDSHVDCSNVRVYSTDEIVRQLMARADWVLGPISESLRDDISNALKHSIFIPATEVALYCGSLSSAELEG